MCSNPLSDPGLPAPWPPLARARNAVMDSGARPWWGQSGGVPGCAPGGPTTFAYIERIFFQYARHIRHADFWFAVIRPLLALPGPPARISYVPLASPDLGAPARRCANAPSLSPTKCIPMLLRPLTDSFSQFDWQATIMGPVSFPPVPTVFFSPLRQPFLSLGYFRGAFCSGLGSTNKQTDANRRGDRPIRRMPVVFSSSASTSLPTIRSSRQRSSSRRGSTTRTSTQMAAFA